MLTSACSNDNAWQHSAGSLATGTLYANSSTYVRKYSHAHHPINLSGVSEVSADNTLFSRSQLQTSNDLVSKELGHITPRDRFTLARERELLPTASASALSLSLPNPARFGAGPWHYETLVSTTRKSLTRSPCFSPRLSPIASAVNHREAVNPAPGQTLYSMFKMQPSLEQRTRMLPVYDRATLDVSIILCVCVCVCVCVCEERESVCVAHTHQRKREAESFAFSNDKVISADTVSRYH